MCCRSDQFYSVFGGFDIIFIRTVTGIGKQFFRQMLLFFQFFLKLRQGFHIRFAAALRERRGDQLDIIFIRTGFRNLNLITAPLVSDFRLGI